MQIDVDMDFSIYDYICEQDVPTDLHLVVARLNIVEEEKKELKEKLDKAIEVKMLLELSAADTINVQQTIIDAQEIKLDEYWSKLQNMRRYAIDKEAWFHYAVGSIVTLAVIFTELLILFRFSR